MSTHVSIAAPPEKSERAAVAPVVVGSPETIPAPNYPDRPAGEIGARTCPICRKPLTGCQRSACSDRCRAAKSRRARIPVKAEELRNLRALVTTTLESLWEAKAKLDRYVGG